MPVTIAQGLYVWTLTLDGGEQRTVLGSSLDTVIDPSMPVIAATRGAAFVDDPPPVAATLVPATAAVGAAPFTLHVTGTGFRPGCQILWNGAPVATTVVSPTELTTPINLAGAVAGAIPVAVRTLAGQQSNELPFAVTAAE